MIKKQRSENEMFDLILGTAKEDERIRAVIMNGSRANPDAPKDRFQDYDIVYVVREFETFTCDHSWIDMFGARIILQMPEAMRNPCGDGRFIYLILFDDCNRIDLTLIPLEKRELISNDSASVALLDKDDILPKFPPASGSDYHIKPPSELFFTSCCNDFWWCLQYTAKGIARDELPYAMGMLNNFVRHELHDMISWHIGVEHGFGIPAGKMGKYFKRYLAPEHYEKYRKTYSDADYDRVWEAVFVMCDLFRELAHGVAVHFGYAYPQSDDDNMTEYLQWVRTELGVQH